MTAELQAIEVITLFVEDLAASRSFYDAVFGAETVYSDDVSTVLKFGSLMINLLSASEAATLVEPLPVVRAGSGTRFIFTIQVPDVDATVETLKQQGIRLLNGPIDRPWGRRTAAFADPSGFVWEVAQILT